MLVAGFAGKELPRRVSPAGARRREGARAAAAAAGCTATLSAPAASLEAERATLEVRFRGHPQLLAWNVSTTLAAPVRVLSGAAGGLAPSGNNTMLVGRSEVELAVRPTEWHDHSGDDDSAVNLTGYALEPRGEAACEASSPHEAASECAASAASADTAADVSLAFRLARTDTVLVKKREAVRGAADAVEQFFAVSAGLLAAMQALFQIIEIGGAALRRRRRRRRAGRAAAPRRPRAHPARDSDATCVAVAARSPSSTPAAAAPGKRRTQREPRGRRSVGLAAVWSKASAAIRSPPAAAARSSQQHPLATRRGGAPARLAPAPPRLAPARPPRRARGRPLARWRRTPRVVSHPPLPGSANRGIRTTIL